jgi:hypothetical protein
MWYMFFLQLQEEFTTLELSVQLAKCVVWSSQKLDQSISLLPYFLTFESDFHILNVHVGFLPFVECFVSKALQKNLSTITNLSMLANL